MVPLSAWRLTAWEQKISLGERDPVTSLGNLLWAPWTKAKRFIFVFWHCDSAEARDQGFRRHQKPLTEPLPCAALHLPCYPAYFLLLEGKVGKEAKGSIPDICTSAFFFHHHF